MKYAWKALSDFCRQLHERIYVKGDKATDEDILALKALLEPLPEFPVAIIHAEALAIYYELIGNTVSAQVFREREIALMQALFDDIRENNYAPETKSAMLADRNQKALKLRLQILSRLKRNDG